MAEVEGREKDKTAYYWPHGFPCRCGDCAERKGYWRGNDESPPEGGHPEYLKLLDELRQIHVLKSGGYGTTDDPFANFTSIKELTGQPAFLYPMHRTIEKLTRCISLEAQGRYGELGEEFLDCASLMLCAEALRRGT